MPKNKTASPAESLGRLISMTAARAQQILARVLEPHDLSPQQWVVLVALWWQDEMSVGELALHLHSEKAAVSRLVDRMEKAGLVCKRPSEHDARSILVSPSEKSKRKKHLRTIYEEINSALLADFSKEEQDQLFALLIRVQKNASDHLDQN